MLPLGRPSKVSTILGTRPIIFIPGNVTIDLTGEKNLLVPSGVTLASDRGKNGSLGALLISNSFFPQLEASALFYTGEDSRITGLRLQGPNADTWDHNYTATGVANAIRSTAPGLIVDNCELYAWDKWAIYLYIQNRSHIHHNHIHHNRRAGYGYGVWIGGAGNEAYAFTLIEANLFEAARHCVASQGKLNSWEARYNVIARQQFYLNFDRHDAIEPGKGGIDTILHHNLFYSTQKHFGLQFPHENGMVRVYENWFARSDEPGGQVGDINEIDVMTINHPQIQLTNNYYSSSNRAVPVATIQADKITGTAPLTIQFNGNDSYDTDGGVIKKYVWSFGEGGFNGNEKLGANTQYTFNQPGKYDVTLEVYNAYGIPSSVATQTIEVKPLNSTKYILSGWIKDSYPGQITGRYVKQILLGTTVVWQDDVAGNEGWQQVVLDLTPYASLGQTKRLSVRLKAIADNPSTALDIVEQYIWVDDFIVFKTNLQNSGFEGTITPWRQAFYLPPGSSLVIGSGLRTSERRSGEQSFELRFSLSQPVLKDTYGEVYQDITFQ